MQTFDVIFCFQVTHVLNKINKIYNREGYGVERHSQQYFCYIIAVCFIGGGNRNTQRKPPTCRTTLTNFIS